MRKLQQTLTAWLNDLVTAATADLRRTQGAKAVKTTEEAHDPDDRKGGSRVDGGHKALCPPSAPATRACVQNVAEMEAMALWQMRPCWGADAAAAAPPRLVARGGVPGVCVSTGDPGGGGRRAVKVRSHHASTRSRCPSLPLLGLARDGSILRQACIVAV
eukprot:COSAG02_NODE_5714_length_4100_cov_9.621939_1_plen_160_part_00